METMIIIIIGTMISVLIGVLTVLSVLILLVTQKVHEEALHTNGRLKDLERKGLFRAGQKDERLKHTKTKGTGT